METTPIQREICARVGIHCGSSGNTVNWQTEDVAIVFLPSPNGPPLKIAIYRSSSIGDVVLATACLNCLAKLKLNTEVTWIGRQPSIALIRDAFPGINCIDIGRHPDLSRNSQVIQDLAQIHFLVDLQGSIRSRMLGLAFRRQYGRPVFTSGKAQVFRSSLLAEARIFGRSRKLPKKVTMPPLYQYQKMVEALEAGLRDQLPNELTDAIRQQPSRPSLPTGHDDGRRPWQKELKLGLWLAVAICRYCW
jgi:ADP-heptose:LPS heptosyltransferase